MEVFNSDHGSNILGCGNLCTAGSQIFKTKEFTWFSEVNYFQCSFQNKKLYMVKRISVFDIPQTKDLIWVGDFSPSVNSGATVDH
jgi:hypothetical protein